MKALTGVGVLAGLGLVAGEALRSWRLVEQLHTAQDAASHDDRTGLLNRRGMGRAVDAAIARDGRAALAIADLHGFKAINDTYGHLAGDEVLIAVAQRINEVLVDGEVAGRHGGDEYGVLLVARPGVWVPSRVAAITTAIQGPVKLSCGTEVVVRASVGAAVAATARELWESADRDERAAKKRHHRQEVAA